MQSISIQNYHTSDPEFPSVLKTIPKPPENLYVLGALPDPSLPSVSIIGSRIPTSYGLEQAYRFARRLSEAGIQVISGMAVGIDTAAHEGALAGGTPTFAILACGPDLCYPPGARLLRSRILQNDGGLISEYPPGTLARRYRFPMRNRIISGLGDLLLVVEATEKSGSLITVSSALEQGKTIYAVPGPLDSPLSAGTNRLLFDGAGVALSPEQLLEEWQIVSAPRSGLPTGMDEDMARIFSLLEYRPHPISHLVRRTGLKEEKVRRILTELLFMGLAAQTGPDLYYRIRN